MTVESIWIIGASIIGGILWFLFQIHIIIGFIIGAFIGFCFTTIMKIFNWKFAKSADYSSSSSNSCDDWD
jgi:hypothetical protein